MKIGVAKVNITPEKLDEVELSGYLRKEKKPVCVKDPIYAKSLFIKTERTGLLWITTDLLGLPLDLVTRCRKVLSVKLDIPESSIMITSTHTHAAPAVIQLLGCGEVNDRYNRFVEIKIIEAGEKAERQLQEGDIFFGQGEEHLSLNRRSLDVKNYPVGNKLDGNMVDPKLSVFKAVNSQGKTLAVLYHYACHPVCLRSDNLAVSSDFVGNASKVIEQYYGNSCTALFINGASGNIIPRLFGSFNESEQMGKLLGNKVIEIAEKAVLEHQPSIIHSQLEWIPLPYERVPTKQELVERSKAIQQRKGSTEQLKDKVIKMHADYWIEHIEKNGAPLHISIPMQKLQFGNLLWIGLAGEVMHGLGELIKASNPNFTTMVVSYANGNIGYIPCAADFAIGGYEVDFAPYVYNVFPFSVKVEENILNNLSYEFSFD